MRLTALSSMLLSLGLLGLTVEQTMASDKGLQQAMLQPQTGNTAASDRTNDRVLDHQEAHEKLMQSAQYWFVRNRPDKVRELLNKLLVITPRSATAMLWQGLTELKFGEPSIAAVWLQRLTTLYPGSAEQRELAEAYRLATEAKPLLLEMRYLSRSDNLKDPILELVPKLKKLFPHGPPLGEAGIEYFEMLRRLPNKDDEIRMGLERLVKHYPNDGRYLIPYARALLAIPGQRAKAIAIAQQALTSPLVQMESIETLLESAREAERAERLARRSSSAGSKLASAGVRGKTVAARQAPAPNWQQLALSAITEQQAKEQQQQLQQAQKLSDQGEALFNAGQHAAGLSALAEAVALSPDPWLRYRWAKALDQAGASTLAKAVMDEGLQEYPSIDMSFATALLAARQDQTETAWRYIHDIPLSQRSPGIDQLAEQLNFERILRGARDANSKTGSQDAAHRLMLAENLAKDDPKAMAAVARAWAELGKRDHAIQRISQWLDRYPFAPDSGELVALMQDYRLELALNDATDLRNAARYQDALALLADLPPSLQLDRQVVAERQALETEQTPWLATGYRWASKSGVPGISQFRTDEIPLYARSANHRGSYVFGQIDALRLDAGSLGQTDAAERRNYGQLAVSGQNSLLSDTLLNQRIARNATAMALGVYHRRLQADIGYLAGVERPRALGGIRWDTQLGPASLQIELARRAATSSYLAMSGASDPATGQRWGGINRDGLFASVYWQLNARQAVSGNVVLANQSGLNVPNNQEQFYRAAFGQQIAQSRTSQGSQTLELGLSAIAWSFDQNLRFYTFGQGGYFSPQRYYALSVPLTWEGQQRAWAWRLRVAAGASQTREANSPFFPTRPDLQTLSGNSIHSGASGSGGNWSLLAHVEYRLDQRLFLGSRLTVDRSKSFAPNTAWVYARYGLGGRLRDELTVPPLVSRY